MVVVGTLKRRCIMHVDILFQTAATGFNHLERKHWIHWPSTMTEASQISSLYEGNSILGTCVLHNLNSKSKWIYLGLYKWAMNMHFHTSFDDNGPMYPCISSMLKQPQMGISIISPFRCPIVSSLDTTCCTH